jgi:hypothetical protein
MTETSGGRVWIEPYVKEDGLFTENWNIGIAERLRQRYESVRGLSIVGGVSTGKKGGRGSESNREDLITTTRPLRRL